MTTKLRTAHSSDIPPCGKAMYEAFKDIAERHNFPPDFPSADAAGGLLGMMLEAPGFEAAVAEDDGEILGSIFVSRRSPVGGISVITVDPKAQNRQSVARRSRSAHHPDLPPRSSPEPVRLPVPPPCAERAAPRLDGHQTARRIPASRLRNRNRPGNRRIAARHRSGVRDFCAFASLPFWSLCSMSVPEPVSCFFVQAAGFSRRYGARRISTSKWYATGAICSPPSFTA